MNGLPLSMDNFFKTMNIAGDFEKWVREKSEQTGIEEECIEKIVKDYLSI